MLADPDDASIERWLSGAAAGLGLEAESVDTDVAGVDALLPAAPALPRVGPGGARPPALLLRGGRRTLLGLAPDLRPRRRPRRRPPGRLRSTSLAPLRGRAEAPGRSDRSPRTATRAGRRGCSCASASASCASAGPSSLPPLARGPAAPPPLRAEGLLARAAALALLHAAELALMITAWWLIGGLVFAGRTDAGWSQAWLLYS